MCPEKVGVIPFVGYLLINDETVHMGTSRELTGFATNRELGSPARFFSDRPSFAGAPGNEPPE
jgi:hypothetical protein